MPGKKRTYGPKSKKNKRSKSDGTSSQFKKPMYVVPRGVVRLSYPGVCPDVMRVELRYNRYQSLNSASPQINVYRGNSVFDPDFSGIGAQPMGHDQWSTFYRRYRVIAAAIKVEFSSQVNSTTGIQGCICALNSSLATSNPVEMLEAAKSVKSKVVSDPSDARGTMSYYITTAEMAGLPADGYLYERDLSAAISSNPVEGWFYHVGFFDASGGLNTVNVHSQTEITYYVEYYHRETLTQS